MQQKLDVHGRLAVAQRHHLAQDAADRDRKSPAEDQRAVVLVRHGPGLRQGPPPRTKHFPVTTGEEMASQLQRTLQRLHC